MFAWEVVPHRHCWGLPTLAVQPNAFGSTAITGGPGQSVVWCRKGEESHPGGQIRGAEVLPDRAGQCRAALQTDEGGARLPGRVGAACPPAFLPAASSSTPLYSPIPCSHTHATVRKRAGNPHRLHSEALAHAAPYLPPGPHPSSRPRGRARGGGAEGGRRWDAACRGRHELCRAAPRGAGGGGGSAERADVRGDMHGRAPAGGSACAVVATCVSAGVRLEVPACKHAELQGACTDVPGCVHRYAHNHACRHAIIRARLWPYVCAQPCAHICMRVPIVHMQTHTCAHGWMCA